MTVGCGVMCWCSTVDVLELAGERTTTDSNCRRLRQDGPACCLDYQLRTAQCHQEHAEPPIRLVLLPQPTQLVLRPLHFTEMPNIQDEWTTGCFSFCTVPMHTTSWGAKVVFPNINLPIGHKFLITERNLSKDSSRRGVYLDGMLPVCGYKTH